MRGLLVVGHGSRRDEANETVRALARELAAAEPSWDGVQAAFLEVVQPDIPAGYAVLAQAGCTDIVVHPFFLFDGNHTRYDIPAALDAARLAHPGTRWTLTRPLGLHPGVVDAVRDRIRAARGDTEPHTSISRSD